MSTLVLGVAAAADRGDADEPTVRWQERDVPISQLPGEAEGGPRATAAAWLPFTSEHGYRMFLEEQGRVLLIVPDKNRTAKKELELIKKTCELFERLLPAPASTADEGKAEAKAASVPRQDEGRPVTPEGQGQDGEAWTYSYSYTWGSADWSRDAETAVLLAARDEKDYSAALDFLASKNDYLKEWVAFARKRAGCSLESPLVAIWLLSGEGLEEYSPENELVHRLATELVLRRFSQQPPWLLQGFSWYVEYELLSSHYCFPWRNEFVFATEHTSWESTLKSWHKKTQALTGEEVTALARGNFQLEHARNAWGAVTFLARHHADALPGLLEDLRLVYAEKGVISHEDGTWERIPDWAPPAADQLALLKKHAGDGVLDELLAFYKQGKAYHPDEGK